MSKFKVGDRVRVVKTHPYYQTPLGFEGTVTKVDWAGDVWFPTKQCPGGECYPPHMIELIDDPNTVEVRIAVAVSSDPDDFPFIETTSLGEWGCDEDAFEHLREELAKPCRISVITAHVPLPEKPAEIEGSVKHA